MREALLAMARHLNGIARSVLEEDGEHVPMFFLRLEDGRVEVRQFEEAPERPVGQLRARELADAVRTSNATAIVMVSEAWSAPEDSIPDGGGAGDASDARDVLLLVALDCDGTTVTLETPIWRLADGALRLGDTDEQGSESQVYVLNEVRGVWGLEEQ